MYYNNYAQPFPPQICSRCGAPLKPGAQFCATCGSPVIPVVPKKFCQNCGVEVKAGAMFCPVCGYPTTQNRDNEALNNIAAYNENLDKPKEAKPLVLNSNSVWSLLSWISVALISAIVTFLMMFVMSDLSGGIKAIPMLAPAMYIATVASGAFFWKKESKFRIIPIITSLIGAAATVFSLVILDGYLYGILWKLLFSFMIFAVHLVVFLITMGVIKTKAAMLSTLLPTMGVFFVLSVFSIVQGFFALGIFLFFMLAIPVFLLAFSFTTKEIQEPTKKKRLIKGAIAIALVVLLSFGSGWIAFDQIWTRVDDFTNQDALTVDGELCFYEEYDFSDTVPKGCVISQSIEPGTFVEKYSDITIVVSRGKGVVIPDLMKLTEKEATNKLKKLGLKVEIKKNYSETIKKGCVMAVSDTMVEEGSTVTLTISKGKDNRVYVPDVVGKTESSARSSLKAVGLKVKVSYVYERCDAYKQTSTVTSQSHGGKVEPGTTVTIYVKKPSISITRVNYDLNSVGGVDVDITFKNTSGKKIQYIIFKARVTDSYGNDADCEIRGEPTRNLKYNGPLSSGRSETAYWDAIIYNWSVRQIHFDEIEVTFSDGTTHVMDYNGYWY